MKNLLKPLKTYVKPLKTDVLRPWKVSAIASGSVCRPSGAVSLTARASVATALEKIEKAQDHAPQEPHTCRWLVSMCYISYISYI